MMSDWTFFSNYGHVLVCLARNREVRLRDVAIEVGITERAVQKIVRDLQDAGFLTVSKQGRCNRYRVNRRKALRHSLESHCTVGKLLALVAKPARTETAGAREAETEKPAGGEVPVEVSEVIEESSLSLPETKAVAEKESERKKELKRAPIETRKQGNLF
jgi:Mn-dependent DtxR family transcriptional regulator